MNYKVKNIFISFLCIAILLVVSLVLLQIWMAHENTPSNNPDWKLTKAILPGIQGIQECLNGPQMFAGEQLNLGVWGAYHEVLYHKPLQVAKLSFRFHLDEYAYLSFIAYNDKGSFDAFRFSAWENYRNAWIKGKRYGGFTDYVAGTPAIFYPFQWHDVELTINNGKLMIVVDGRAIREVPTILSDLAQLGFRSGLGDAHVDDVRIETIDGNSIQEDFSYQNGMYWRLGTMAGIIGVLSLIFLALCKLFRRNLESSLELLFACASALLLFSVVAFYFYTLSYSFKETPINAPEVPSNEKIAQTIKETHRLEKEPGEVRILFLGSSQTWGEGAFDARGNFVSFVSQYLPLIKPGSKTYVINGATQSPDITKILPLYLDVYREYKPDIVVVNLPGEKENSREVAKMLEDLMALNNVDSARTVLMLEGHSPEDTRTDLESYATIREMAKKHNLPIIEPNKFLLLKLNEGFLFWDYAQPTNYGHDQISQSVLSTLGKIIDELRPPAPINIPVADPKAQVPPSPRIEPGAEGAQLEDSAN